MKRLLAYLTVLIFFGAFLLISACYIGLGSAVDTEAPEISIETPAVDVIIRDTFAISGTWSDDGTIDSITVLLERTDGNGSAITRDATFSITTGETGSGPWSCILDPSADSDNIIDGSYQATVTIADSSGHKTILTRTFSIDNTPPVVILSDLKSADDNTTEIKTYGRLFNLNGKAADDNNINKIDVMVYSDAACTNLLKTVTLNNVPPTIEMNVATFKAGENNDYSIIYESTVLGEGSTSPRYCKILAYDDAQRYPPDGTLQTAEDTLGNAQTIYYSQKVLESLNLDTYKTTELYSMFSGNYGKVESSRVSTVSSVADTVKAELKENEISVGTFKLNPKNNPTFTVVGLNKSLVKGESMENQPSYEITNGTEQTGILLTINIVPGLDNYAIDTDTVKAYFQACNADGSLKNESPILIGEKKSTIKSNPIAKNNYAGLQPHGNYYRVIVKGSDTKENAIEEALTSDGNEQYFVFKLVPANGFIELNVSSTPEYVSSDSSVNPEGHEQKLYVTLRYSYNGEEDLSLYRAFNREPDKETDTAYRTNLNKGTDLELVDEIEASDLVGKTTLYYFLSNETGSSESKKRSINVKVDNSKPEITSVTCPAASATSENSFKFEGKVSDVGSGIEKIDVTLSDEDDPTKNWTTTISKTTSWSFSVINDGKFRAASNPSYGGVFAKDGKKKIKVVATDGVGLKSNEYEAEWHYKSTKPEFKFTGYTPSITNATLQAKNVNLISTAADFSIGTAYTISGTLSDEYGIDTVTCMRGSTSVNVILNSEKTEWSITETESNLPATGATGEYEYIFTVKDKAGIEHKTKSLKVSIDRKAPDLKEITLPGTGSYGDDSLSGSAYSFKGKAEDASPSIGMKAVRYAIKKSGETPADGDWTDASLNGENWSITKSLGTGTSGNDSTVLYEGKYVLYVKAVDKADNESSLVTRDFCIDKSAPTISEVKVVYGVSSSLVREGDNIIINNKNTASNFHLEVKTSDSYGIKSVKANYGSDSVLLTYDTESAVWKSADFTAQQAYNFDIEVEDESGNNTISGRKTTRNFTVLFDKVAPTFTSVNVKGEVISSSDDNSTKWYKEQTVYIEIEASDEDESGGTGSGVETIEVVGLEKNTEPGASSEWTSLTKKTDSESGRTYYKGNVVFPDGANEEGRLYIRATDKAENTASFNTKKGTETVGYIVFNIDTTAPVLTLTENIIPAYMKVDGMDITGTASDDFGLASSQALAITEKFTPDSGSVVTTTEYVESFDENNAWSHHIPFTSGQGSYEYTFVLKDKAGNSPEKITKTTIADSKRPKIISATIGGKTYNTSNWYKSQTLSLEVTASDEGASGIDTVEYSTDDSSVTNKTWTSLTADADVSGKYKGPVEFTSIGSGKALYIRARDKANNVKYFDGSTANGTTTETELLINIDTAAPVLAHKFYQVADGDLKAIADTVYVNSTSSQEVSLYGTISELDSGVNSFTVSGFTVSYSTSDIKDLSASDLKTKMASTYTGDDKITFGELPSDTRTVKSWKAVKTFTADGSSKITMSATDKAGLSSENLSFTLVRDITAPTIPTFTLEDSTGKEQYSSSTGVYYVNNEVKSGSATTQTKKFTLSGTASDKYGIASVTITSDAIGSISGSQSTNKEDWTFENFEITGSDGQSKTIEVKVIDNAGNIKSQSITINIDTTAPTKVLQLDAKNKDVYFRIGKADNDDVYGYTKTDTYDTDVGKKYEENSYGNDNTILLRGRFKDGENGSGVKLIYYKVFTMWDGNTAIWPAARSTMTDLTASELETLIKNVTEEGDVKIVALSEDDERRVFFNVERDDSKVVGTKVTGADGIEETKFGVTEDGEFDIYYKKIKTNFKTSIAGFEDGINYLVLVAEDYAGNKQVIETSVPDFDANGNILQTCTRYSNFKVNVDVDPPEITSNDSEEIIKTRSSQPVSISGRVSDGAAGIYEQSFKITIDNKSSYKINNVDTPVADVVLTEVDGSNGKEYTWSATIPSAILKAVNKTNISIMASVKDESGTGNPKSDNIANITIDDTPPTVTITTPTDQNTATTSVIDVNGIIDIEGKTNNDPNLTEDPDNSAGTMVLYYTTNSTLGAKTGSALAESVDVENAVTADASSAWRKYGTTKHGTAWTFENINTRQLKKTDAENDYIANESTVYFTVSASDTVGNIGYANPLTVKFDQDTDRPIVTLSDISNKDVTIESKVLHGTVDDDDGNIKKLWYWSKKAKNDTAPTQAPTLSDNKGWTVITFKGTSWSVDARELESDGSAIWYFAVADANDKIFAALGSDALDHPYIIYGSNAKVDGDADGVTFSYDTTAPNIDLLALYRAATGTTTTASAIKTQDANAETSQRPAWSSNSNQTFGGNYNVLYAKVVVKEGTGMMALTGTSNTAVPTTSPVSISYEDKDGKKLTKGQIEKIDDLTTGTYTYYLGPIVVNTTEVHDFKVIAKDAVGNEGSKSISIIADNEAPSSLSNIKPASNEPVDGEVNFSGLISDNEGGAGILYKTNDSGTVTDYGVEYCIPTYAQANAVALATDKKATIESQTHTWSKPTKMGSAMWEIQFQNLGNSPLEYNGNDSNYVNANYSGFETESGSRLYDIPVWFKLTDAVGNVGYVTSNSIRYNPDADRPTASITYPTHDKPSAAPEYVSLGGTITISGSANDNTAVKAVYLQFDMNGDGNFTDADWSVSGSPFTTSGESPDVVTIPNMGGAKGVLAEGTKSWYKSFSVTGLNGLNNETEVIADRKTLNIRAVAIENDPTKLSQGHTELHGAWSNVLHISVNNAVPNFSGLKLQKFTTAPTSASLATAIPVGEDEYRPDKWINGNETNWYLVGDVEVSGATDTLNVISVTGEKNLTYSTTGSKTLIAYMSNSGKKCTFAIPVNLQNADGTYKKNGTYSLTLSATKTGDTSPGTNTITINLDGTAPTFADTKTITPASGQSYSEIKLYKNIYGTGTEISNQSAGYIQQSSGAFTLAGKVYEAGSEFSRLVFYFKRVGSSETRVYNPMEEHGANNDANKAKIESKTKDKVYINAQELPVLYLSGATRNNDNTITSDSIKNNKNIRKCGLIKIGGVYRQITDVSDRDSSGTITFSPACDKTKYTEAEIVYGMVIDSNDTETNDDGDGMIESYSKSSSDYIWDARINSKNIPDGPIQLHCVVFDKAGNSNHGYTTTYVSNNAPRLTSVKLGTDLNSDNKYNIDSEFDTFYYSTNADGSHNLTEALSKWPLTDSSNWTAKKDLVVIPEFVGGSGQMYYIYSKSTGENKAGLTNPAKISNSVAVTELLAGDDNIIDNTGSKATIVAEGSGNKVGAIILKNDTVDGAGKISTSIGEGEENIYSFTFWDSTEECTPGENSQWAILNATFKQDLVDGAAPSGSITPFTWTGKAADNNFVQWNGSSALGHIEVAGELPAAFKETGASDNEMDRDPKVSGKIKIRGTASDETRLGSITLAFADQTVTSTYNATSKTWTDPSTMSTDYKLTVTDASGPVQGGHHVTWTLEVDTSKVKTNAIAALNQSITLTVKDAKPNSTSATPYQVDIVPYITKISTRLDDAYSAEPSVFNRSANGKYPVQRSESGFKLYGFNLNGASTTVKFNGTSVGTVSAKPASDTTEGDYVSFTVPSSAKSGDIDVSVNSAYSLNNKNSETAEYNLEPNNLNNNTLNDDRRVHVWGMKNVVSGVTTVRYPSFRIGKDANQTVGFVYDRDGRTVYYYRKVGTNTASSSLLDTSYSQWYATACAVDSAGHIYGSAQNGDSGGSGNIYDNGNKANYKFYALADTANGKSYSLTSGAYSQGGNNVALESCVGPGDVFYAERVKNPKIATLGSDTTKMYTVYYDSAYPRLVFRYGEATGPDDENESVSFDSNYGITSRSSISAPNVQVIDNDANVGEYAAVGVIPTGVTGAGTAVVCWNSDNKLLFKYNTNPASNTWSDTITIDSDYAGEFCDLAVDAAGGIHIAYYRAGNKLKYAYLSSYTDTVADVCMVDSYLSVGENISIETSSNTITQNGVTRYVPYISYYSSAIGMAKVAWPVALGTNESSKATNTFTNGVDTDKFTGTWEVQVLPTTISTKLLNYTIGVGEKTNGTANSVMLGYGTKNGLQTALLY